MIFGCSPTRSSVSWARAARAPTTCGGWRSAGGCSTGPARASTTSSPSGWPLGYLEARKEPGKTRERTVYTLTGKGREALREWAATPAAVTPLKSEALIRLLIADLVGGEATRTSLEALRADVADLQARLEESEASAEQLPHRRAYLALVNEFLRRFLELHLDLVDELEREAPAP